MKTSNCIVILGHARMQCVSKAGISAQSAPKAHNCVYDKSYAGSPNVLGGTQSFEDDDI